MSVLHLFNRRGALTAQLDVLQAGDAVLLCADAVLDAATALPPQVGCHVLLEDAQARGLPVSPAAVDYNGFVELCVRHAKVVAW